MQRKIAMIANQIEIKSSNEELENWIYWQTKTPDERLKAVTFLIRQNMTKDQKMDRTHSSQIHL
jgi:hypothetical protein